MASIVSRGNMSQKSISSFFSKPATKKTAEKKSAKDDLEENPAKTKTCQDSSSATLTKKRVGVIDSDSDDDSKENSKVLANKAKEPEQPVLDEDGLPPLRKTARNPAFKRKSESGNEDSKKLKEDKEDKDGEKEEVAAIKEEEEMEVESPVKKGSKKASKKKVIESDEENSPVKKPSPIKKKGVIESDDDSPVKKTPTGRKKKTPTG